MDRLALSALLLVIVAVWGWTFTVVKDAVESYGVVSFLAIRFFIGSACIGLFSAKRADRTTLRVGAGIGTVLGTAYLCQTFGLRYTTATNTGLITGLFIVFAPIANRILFGVRTHRVLWGAIAVILLGLTLLAGGAPKGVSPGDALTLLGAACFGLHVVLLDRYAKRHDAACLAFGQLSAAMLLFLVLWPFTGEPIAWPAPDVWFALLLTGIVASAAGFYVQTFVQQRLSAVETAVIIVTEPIFCAVFAYLLASERLTCPQIIGAVLMFGAMFVAEIYPLVRKARQGGFPSSDSPG